MNFGNQIMPTFHRFSIAFLAALAVALSGTLGVAARADDTASLPARNVLRQYCHRCHNGPGSEGGDFDVLKTDSLATAELIAAKQPGASRLIERIVKGEMPPAGQPQPGVAEISLLWNWIEGGAAAFPNVEKREPIAAATVLETAAEVVQKLDPRHRPFQRFFTLQTIYNHPDVTVDDLRLYRAALSKALNSVSRASRIIVPKAIDKAETLFLIDLRDLNWDRNDLWKELAKAYPYGLKYGSHPDEALRRADERLSELTHSDLPILRGDWFIANATRPPLYHTLLELPHSAKMLEADLGVDLLANFEQPKPERIARAGFAKSGVSGQNRLVERHQSRLGVYWASYDFKPDSSRARLLRFPLGPLNLFPAGKHPYADQAFVHDGGELIFSLPNGLHGYMLVDGQGARIDAGPIAVVSDALKTSGTSEIVTGVSCIACHKQGMIRFRESIREHNAVFGRAEQKVRDLYPPQETWDKLLDQDQQQYLTALEKAIGPFLRQGTDKGKPIAEFEEPVGEVSRRYRLGFLDRQTIGSELDLPDPMQLVQRIGEKKLKQLGLEVLLEKGGVISRAEWEAVNGVSLMQEVTRELRATPYRQL
jgi:mono/diheme cytochrome c family protein